jgi:hypothetical protein
MKSIIFDYVRQWHHSIKHDSHEDDRHQYYMLLHTKTALVKSDDSDKVRTIWGTPKSFVLAEIMFHWALLAHYKRNPGSSPLLWSYETITGGWIRLNSELYLSFIRGTILSIDKSRFDKYALFEAFDDLDAMTRSFLTFSRGYLPDVGYPDTESDWSPEKTERLERLWRWTCRAFRNTPIVLPDGRSYSRKHAGIPSGLYTTQYRDSVYNYLTICTCFFAMGITPSQILKLKVQGDDSLSRLYISIPPSEHEAFLLQFKQLDYHYFGSIVNDDKSKITNDLNKAEVLSYQNFHGLPLRDPLSLLAQFYHTKASRTTPSKTMAAAIGFAYATMGQLPTVYRICKDIHDYYAAQGFTPDMSAVDSMIYTAPIENETLPPTFPTYSDILSTVLNSSYSEPETMKTFFPMTHFLSFF